MHKVRFEVITLFPSMFKGPLSESILKRAQNSGLIYINLTQLRDFALDKHKTVDDAPYGGGAGMVLKVDVVDQAIASVKRDLKGKTRTILLTPKGHKFDQKKAIELSGYNNLILICGHYEGFDQRIHQHLADEEVSIGDYVLTGGELPAMVVVDAISRMVSGVIRKESVESESFMPKKLEKSNEKQDSNKYQIQKNNITTCLPVGKVKQFNNETMIHYDYPTYTRPLEYKGWSVPEVLLSGNHKKIKEWRESQK